MNLFVYLYVCVCVYVSVRLSVCLSVSLVHWLEVFSVSMTSCSSCFYSIVWKKKISNKYFNANYADARVTTKTKNSKNTSNARQILF